MNEATILILGGTGNTGRPLAELLLRESSADLILAGRNLKKAETLAAEFNHNFNGDRVSARQVDAADAASLRQAFDGLDLVVVASSTADFVPDVAAAALQAGIDYLDVQYSTHKVAVLQALSPEIVAAGRCFITDGGFHPGLPAALIRYLAPQFDTLTKARVGSVIKIDWSSLTFSPETMDEFVGEFMDFQSIAFRDGRWQKVSAWSMMKPETMDFGPPFGRQYSIPMFLEEMRAIPELYPEIQETGFSVGGFNWFVDWLLSPIIMVALKLSPNKARRPMGNLMFWGLRTFSKPPYGTLLKVEAQGQVDGLREKRQLILCHPDGYLFTAIPAAACLLQYLDGSIRKPGLWLQANLVDPARLMADMQRMGIEVEDDSSRFNE